MFFFFPFTERIFTRSVGSVRPRNKKGTVNCLGVKQAKRKFPLHRTAPPFQPIDVRIFVASCRGHQPSTFYFDSSISTISPFFIHYPIKSLKNESNLPAQRTALMRSIGGRRQSTRHFRHRTIRQRCNPAEDSSADYESRSSGRRSIAIRHSRSASAFLDPAVRQGHPVAVPYSGTRTCTSRKVNPFFIHFVVDR